MNILVTAGNTQVLLDRVRCLTNIFTGRTGAAIALEAYRRGHRVTLLTSHPDVVRDLPGCPDDFAAERWRTITYRTFDDLEGLLEKCLREGKPDVVIHSAAVSDYRGGGIFAPQPGTRFDLETNAWLNDVKQAPALVDRTAGKVKSDEPELWLRLVRTPKLIDRFRRDWGFAGTLVKFKLEVGLSDEDLLRVAEASRSKSQADWMVANTLEDAGNWAFLGPFEHGYEKVARRELAGRLLDVAAPHRDGM